MQSITDIAFESITPEYSWGRYGEFKVIIQMSTGYINATHLCGLTESKAGNKKEFRYWKLNTAALELIDELSSSVGIPTDGLVTVLTGVQNDIRGTYVHPDLIPHIASWASPKFAIKVSKIVNAYMIREAVAGKQREIDTLNAKLDRLIKQNDELLTTAKELKEQNNTLLAQNEELLDTTHELKEDNAILDKDVQLIGAKLNIAVTTRVPPQPAGAREMMRIYAKKHTETERDEMKVLRCQERSISATMRRFAKEGYTELVVAITPTPDSVDLWKRLADRLKKETEGKNPRVYTVRYTSFALRTAGENVLTRADLAALVNEIDAVKEDVQVPAAQSI